MPSICCSAQGGPGCGDDACEACVCGVDEFCCNELWDSGCADIARQSCLARCCPSGCTGDCDGTGRVTIDELIAAVNVALGRLPIEGCQAIDRNADGRARIDELIQAVRNGVDQCPVAPPTATHAARPTASPTPAPVPTATGSPTATHLETDTPTRTVTRTRTPTRTGTRLPTASSQLRDVALGTQAAMRVALSSFAYLTLLHDVLAAAQDDAACPEGGSAAPSCAPSAGGGATRSVVFDACRSLTSGSHLVERNGIVRRTVPDCGAPFGGDDESFRVELEGFRLEETLIASGQGPAAGDAPFLDLRADLEVEISTGRERCAGLDAVERYEGSLELTCSGEAEALACPEQEVSLTLAVADLIQDRNSGGTSCTRFTTARGELTAQDRLAGETYNQFFDDLSVSLIPDENDPGEGDLVTVDGRMRVDCVGAIDLDTARPLRVARGSSCPFDGELVLKRPRGAGSEAAGAGSGTAGGSESNRPASGPEPRGVGGSGFRQFLFRAVGGQVYQVIQNDDSANNADAIHLTTLAGSLGDSVATCTNAAGVESDPVAAAVVPGGAAFPVDRVALSDVIGSVALPCFNRSAEDGRGRVCIGECQGGCVCPEGGACTAFTLDQGIPLAALGGLAPVELACGGFPSREAYAFGAAMPTTERELCSSTPSDGIRLPLGETLIVAYDTQPFEIFNAGVAGFPLDLDGDSNLCPGTTGVLSPGRAESDTAAGPRIEFGAGRSASADYDGDGRGDQVFLGCAIAARIDCAAPTNPTPTPTVDPNRPCGATVLDNAIPVDVRGSTAGRPDSAGEAGCGWGGGSGGPDQVFEYVAPAAGVYGFDVDATGFTPYLYVRSGSCLPDRPERGCAHDAEGEGKARLSVTLAEAERIAIVVDGGGPTGAEFRLTGRRRQADLIVESVAGPTQASGGDRVPVSAVVANVGDAAAEAFEVEFVFVADDEAHREIGARFTRCSVPGLAPGGRVECAVRVPIEVPLVAEGEYRLQATADAERAVDESSEGNNVGLSEVARIGVRGATLEQQVYRAADGTVYHVVQAVPRIADTGASSFRITAIAASSGTIQQCALSGALSGEDAVAAIGAVASEALPIERVRRTRLLRPDDFSRVEFDPAGGGRLVLGSAVSPTEICRRGEQCPSGGEALRPAASADPSAGVPAACAGTSSPGAFCPGFGAARAIGFGVGSSAASCVTGGQITTVNQICEFAPQDGFLLRAGESMVFVYDAGRAKFTVDVAGYALARTEANPAGCRAASRHRIEGAPAGGQQRSPAPLSPIRAVRDRIPLRRDDTRR